MDKIKNFLLAVLFTIGLFGTVIYTSCNKSTCTGVVCQNGGLCIGSACTCPTGYSGSFCERAALSYVSYRNNTFTPVNISINGTNTIIPVGGTVSFSGTYGSIASGIAYTSASAPLGVGGSGGSIGEVINWQFSAPFPASDTLKDTINVGATYFFLRLTNKSSYNIINYKVNSGFTHGASYEDVTVPNNGVSYDLGYYLAYSNSNIETTNSNSGVAFLGVSLPFTSNQLFAAVISN